MELLGLVLLLHSMVSGCGADVTLSLPWKHTRSSSMCSNSQEQNRQQQESLFLRNCSTGDTRPSFFPSPADIEALGHVLHNRTVAFIGDSTTQSQVEMLIGMHDTNYPISV